MMDNRIRRLREWGCDTAGAMARMLDDEEFYIECLEAVLEDQYFEGLKDALDNKDVKTAFECAHALKGVLGNVGLTPMYEKDIEIVEPLRMGSCEGLAEKANILLEMRKYARNIMAEK